MLYGILAGNKVYLSEIARFLNEKITLKKTIDHLSRNLFGFSEKGIVMVVVYGFGKEPMLLLTNLGLTEKKKLCIIATKVYLMRWRIEEYFKFKEQQFEFEDLRGMSLQSIRKLNLFTTLAAGYIAIINAEKEDTIFMLELKECSKRIYDIPKFIFYALGYAIERVLSYDTLWYKRIPFQKGTITTAHLG